MLKSVEMNKYLLREPLYRECVLLELVVAPLLKSPVHATGQVLVAVGGRVTREIRGLAQRLTMEQRGSFKSVREAKFCHMIFYNGLL